MILFHGSNDENLKEIETCAYLAPVFCGIFTSASETSAESHGDYLYSIEIDDNDIVSDFDDIDYETTKTAFDKIVNDGDFGLSVDFLWQAIVEDNHDGLWDLVDSSEAGEISWALQSKRGELAQKLGYKAVEMDDEHGTSYLVVSNDIEIARV